MRLRLQGVCPSITGDLVNVQVLVQWGTDEAPGYACLTDLPATAHFQW